MRSENFSFEITLAIAVCCTLLANNLIGCRLMIAIRWLVRCGASGARIWTPCAPPLREIAARYNDFDIILSVSPRSVSPTPQSPCNACDLHCAARYFVFIGVCPAVLCRNWGSGMPHHPPVRSVCVHAGARRQTHRQLLVARGWVRRSPAEQSRGVRLESNGDQGQERGGAVDRCNCRAMYYKL